MRFWRADCCYIEADCSLFDADGEQARFETGKMENCGEDIGFVDVIDILGRCTLGTPLQRIEGEQRGCEAAFNVGLCSDKACFQAQNGLQRVFARENNGGASCIKSETISVV